MTRNDDQSSDSGDDEVLPMTNPRVVFCGRLDDPTVPDSWADRSRVVAATSLLGGVYYSTSVIPSWIHHLSDIIPLTYALRAARRLVLDGASVGAVRDDVAMLALLTGAFVVLGWVSFGPALRYARRTGSLSHY